MSAVIGSLLGEHAQAHVNPGPLQPNTTAIGHPRASRMQHKCNTKLRWQPKPGWRTIALLKYHYSVIPTLYDTTPSIRGRRTVAGLPFFCCHTAQPNSVGICDTIDATRRALPGFPVKPSGGMRSDGSDYDVSTERTLHVSRALPLQSNTLDCAVSWADQHALRPHLKGYCAACTLPSTSLPAAVKSAAACIHC